MEVILLLIRIFLFAVFAAAGVGKLLDRAGAEKAARDFGAPEEGAKILAVALPFAEIVFAVCFLFAGMSWLGAIGALILLLSFIGGMIFQIAQGRAPDCHCFGALHSEPVSKKSLARNIVFALLALALVARGRANQGLNLADLTNEMAMQLILGLTIVALLGAAVFYLKKISGQQVEMMRRIDVLELVAHEGGERDVTREDAGSPHDGLPIGAPFPDFELSDLYGKTVNFEHLLGRAKPLLFFFVSPTCAPCDALFPEIERWREELGEKIEFVFLTSGIISENVKKFGDHNRRQVLLQMNREVAEVVRAKWTPSALFVNAGGEIASHIAAGDGAIRELVGKIKAENLDRKYLYFTGGANNRAGKPKIGERVPETVLRDLDGREITPQDFRGRKTLVTFWSTTCPHCLTMIRDLQQWDREKGADDPALILFSEGDAEDHREIGLRSPIVLDEGFKTAQKFGMFGTPSAVLVDEEGVIVSETAVGAPNVWALLGKRK